jgi:hypothetical protein
VWHGLTTANAVNTTSLSTKTGSGKGLILTDNGPINHVVVTSSYWTPWGMMWHAHSDTIGAEYSPYGSGKTEAEAREDLAWQIEDLNE